MRRPPAARMRAAAPGRMRPGGQPTLGCRATNPLVRHRLSPYQPPRQSAFAWLTIVPVAESRSSYNGLLLFVLIAVAASLAAYVIHRWASQATRRSAPWDCGFPDPSPATQYTAGSFAQPHTRFRLD